MPVSRIYAVMHQIDATSVALLLGSGRSNPCPGNTDRATPSEPFTLALQKLMLGTALEPPIPDLALVQAPVAQKPETLLKLQVQPEGEYRHGCNTGLSRRTLNTRANAIFVLRLHACQLSCSCLACIAIVTVETIKHNCALDCRWS